MAQKVNPVDPDSKEAKEIRADFDAKVNMTRKEIEDWLDTEESRSVGQGGDDGGDTVGRDSAKKIVKLLDKRAEDLTSKDLAHMKKTNGYIARHLKQRPDKGDDELREMDWTYSLRNWGHDPLK